MKPRRRWIAVLLVVAVLLLALTLAVRFLLPVDRFVMAALDDLRARSGAELAVGDARVDLWPTPRIVLTGVAAHGSGAALDELGVTATSVAAWTLTVKSVTARPDWRELVGRRAVLRDVRLDQPRLEWTAADGGAANLAQKFFRVTAWTSQPRCRSRARATLLSTPPLRPSRTPPPRGSAARRASGTGRGKLIALRRAGGRSRSGM